MTQPRSEGDVCTIGPGDGWLNTEFFRQYGTKNLTILGMAKIQVNSGASRISKPGTSPTGGTTTAGTASTRKQYSNRSSLVTQALR